jgi:hypothetical protein
VRLKIEDIAMRILKQLVLRVIRKGGTFSFHDLFLNKKIYGKVEDLLKTISGWSIKEVYFINTADAVNIPLLLRTNPWFLSLCS